MIEELTKRGKGVEKEERNFNDIEKGAEFKKQFDCLNEI